MHEEGRKVSIRNTGIRTRYMVGYTTYTSPSYHQYTNGQYSMSTVGISVTITWSTQMPAPVVACEQTRVRFTAEMVAQPNGFAV